MRMPVLSHRGLIAAAATAMLLPAVCLAHDYTYLEGGYVSVDNGSNDDGGYNLGASLNVLPNLAVIGEWTDTGPFEQLSAGGLFHTPLTNTVDINLGATFEHADAGAVDDTGYGLRGGMRRWAVPGKFELIPEVRYVDVFNSDATSLRATGLVRVARQLDLEGMVQSGDDDRFGVGLRYNFGDSASNRRS